MLIATNGKFYRDSAEITQEEYNRVLALMKQKPTAPDGYGYRFTAVNEWELYELPPAEEDPEVSAEEALAELQEVLA